MLKVLNINTTGEVSVIYKEGIKDICIATNCTDLALPRSVRDAMEALIVQLQENSFYEIHMEESNGKAFTHKMGLNSFEYYEYDDHKLIQTLAK